MESFEELGLSPELVEALSAEGVERPSDFQEQAVPILRRGNNLVAQTGPGAGVLVGYGAPLLDRLPAGDEEREGPLATVLVPTVERATALARSLGPLARATGHRVAALGGTWSRPEASTVLFTTAGDLLQAVRASRVKLASVDAFILDGAGAIDRLEGFETVETVAGLVPSAAQKVVLALPMPDDIGSFVEGHVKRAVHFPPGSDSGPESAAKAPHRGSLRFRTIDGDRTEAGLRAVADVLEREDIDHALVHFRSDDEAADVGDLLTLHGFRAGAPGDASTPVWLGTSDRESRNLLDDLDDADRVATISFRVPMDPDALDRRHARGGFALTLLRPREHPHLESAAAVAGYEVGADDAPDSSARRDVEAFRDRIRAALDSEDLAAYQLLLEPLFERHGSAHVAAAAAALLRARGEPAAPEVAPAAGPAPQDAPGPERGWVRLFMSLGDRDDAGPGDVLGAITGEAQIDGSRVGRIDIRDTYSIVEVEPGVAEKVIQAVNGTTVKGRSVRVDFDRPRGGPGGGRRQGRGASRHGR